ncbi:unnamed protein product [Owenia fusiformis]|uniref:Uncharacterized protein n=1 Tax=Owenia fusiformis TaxID=6347 RepID=A0A8S4N8D9_OWEFU|nr:unnamed protein product [Owenia fusiformis]
MELIFSKLLILIGLTNHMTSATYHDSNGCHAGDYMLVRRLDRTYENKTRAPQCEKLLGFLCRPELQSPGQCFKLACEVGANVIYFDLETECSAYQCDFNVEEHDWDYKWKEKKSSKGRTYALPHPASSRCHNSYFVRRTWDRQESGRSTCHRITSMSVDSLEDCKVKACNDKANTLNFDFEFDVDGKTDHGHACETMYCNWNSKEYDYDIKVKQFRSRAIVGRVEVYSLAHMSKTCNGLRNSTVKIPLHVPRKCGKPGYFKNDLFIPNLFCDSGFNSFQHQNADSTYTTFKCDLNDEGTEWAFYDDNEYIRPDLRETEWLVLPPPGTPNCGSDKIFRLRKMKAEHKMSLCSHSERIAAARDLRQCMLYACERGNVNVINYYYSSEMVVCDLRICAESANGDYSFQYAMTDGNHGYDVYALQSDPTIEVNTMIKPPKENVTLTPTNSTNTYLSELNSARDEIARLKNGVAALVTILIMLLLVGIGLCVRYKSTKKRCNEWSGSTNATFGHDAGQVINKSDCPPGGNKEQSSLLEEDARPKHERITELGSAERQLTHD